MEAPFDHSAQKIAAAPSSDRGQSMDYAPYPKIDPADIESPPPYPANSAPKFSSWNSNLDQKPLPTATGSSIGHEATSMPAESNPYVTPSPVPSSSKNTMESLKDVLGKWGKKLGETAKKSEDLAGNVWQHLKTGPNFADAAMGRIAQGTKVIAEGGYEKIFRQTFDTFQEEQLKKAYACYLSTSAGPVLGTLYLSTAKMAFCSDNPLSYTIGDKTEWSYYKVLVCSSLIMNDPDTEDQDGGACVMGFEVPRSPESSYNNPIPGNEDEARDPPIAPPHLQHTLLGYSASQEGSSSLPSPQNVILNHLYIENRESPRSVVALGITHRFRSKFVTVILYKPVQRR